MVRADNAAEVFNLGQAEAVSRAFFVPTCRLWVFVVLLCIVALPRIGFLGNPDYHVDEEFYGLVADRMWKGDLPYVDIWDRKPVGLFLIYAGLHPFNGGGLVGVQLAGILSSALTAFVIWNIVRRYADTFAAFAIALLYPCWTMVFGGANGQSPVFYNLLIVSAVLLVLRSIDEPETIKHRGLLAMLLGGMAIQVKYTAIFEVALLGLGLAAIAWRTMAARQATAWITLWATLALLPTLSAWLTYEALGHGPEFVQANFTSIFLRARLQDAFQARLIRFIIVVGMPMFGMALIGGLRLARASDIPREDRLLLLGWTGAALVGFSCIGNFYDHYTLPLIAPMVILSLPLFFNRTVGLPVLGAALIWIGVFLPYDAIKANRRSRATLAGMASDVKQFLGHGSLFIWDGPSALYVASQAAPPSRFAYPDHLDNIVEAGALGVDSGREMRRILAARPAVIVTSDRRLVPLYNPTTRTLIAKALSMNYVEYSKRMEGWGTRSYIINVRRDLCRCSDRPASQLVP
ncbi:glycosyltransferase family 39 protein [Sphingomonas sp. BK235]|uniref:ArnT family glycosyltransferase n=1 Tax=Sphingomonas sp. BK235 TaxID=2512131 RepID=UPI00104AD376|nr:glycosyltransferase family 39 protein [Sphingomonas sp. BK235]TCP29359.1 dolichyl-phosphate-mannose-protein mannosyltransferase [Sphingomonas sp. BK235]